MHRFDRWTVRPGSAVWLQARLDLSLNVIQPYPGSASVRIILAYRSRALTVRAASPAASASAYARSKSGP